VTTTYGPNPPEYFGEGDLRSELSRVYDLCHGCRLCLSLCPSFPTMFNLIDAKDGDVAALTPTEQDQVVDECCQCKLCYLKCPYVPPHEWQLDFPRLMLRSVAVAGRHHGRFSDKLTTQALGRTHLLGRIGSRTAPMTNALIGTPGSLVRRLMEQTVGVAAERVLPPYAKVRFTTWFKSRVARHGQVLAGLSRRGPSSLLPAWSSTRTRRSARTW
jgi:glycerol-3-phosphate dehydrogenase subunit C